MGGWKHEIYTLGGDLMRMLKKFDTSNDLDIYRELYDDSAISQRRFYNIGAGNFHHPAWTNIDGDTAYRNGKFSKYNYCHYQNLFDHQPLPIETGTAELIYTSHTIEHIDDESLLHLLHETHRALKPGGVLRIVTPDIILAYQAWQRNDRRFFFWAYEDKFINSHHKYCLNTSLDKASLTQLFLEDFASHVSEIATVGATERISDDRLRMLFETLPFDEALNYCTSGCTPEIQRQFPFRHINWFHENKLRQKLSKAGFNHIYRSGFLQSKAHVLRNLKYFDGTLPQLSLYMEAER